MTIVEIAGLPGAGKTSLSKELERVAGSAILFHDNRESGLRRPAFFRRVSRRVRSAARFFISMLAAGSGGVSSSWRFRKEAFRLVAKLSYRESKMEEACSRSENASAIVLSDAGFVQPLLEACLRRPDGRFLDFALALLGASPCPGVFFVVATDPETAVRRDGTRERQFYAGLDATEASLICRHGGRFLREAGALLSRRGAAVIELDGNAVASDMAGEMLRHLTTSVAERRSERSCD